MAVCIECHLRPSAGRSGKILALSLLLGIMSGLMSSPSMPKKTERSVDGG